MCLPFFYWKRGRYKFIVLLIEMTKLVLLSRFSVLLVLPKLKITFGFACVAIRPVKENSDLRG